MRIASPFVRAVAGMFAGAIVSAVLVMVISALHREPPPPRLVPETASGALQRIAIHYVPAQDAQAHPLAPIPMPTPRLTL